MNYNLCCPQCGNHDLQAINETSTQTTGGGYSAGKGCLGYLIFGPLGLLCGGCGSGAKTTTTNTTYWVCSKCGKKFKSPQDLRKEVENNRNGIPAMVICGIIITLFAFFIVFGVVFKGEHPESGETFFGIILSLIPAITSIIVASSISNSLDEKENEIYELEEKMRKHSSGNNHLNTSHISNCSSSNPTSSQWTCVCGSTNAATNNYCKNCGKKREVSLQEVAYSNKRVGTNEWLCSKCGRVNQNYVGTCGCGEGKPSSNTSSISNDSNYVTCPECKTKQTSDHTNCYRCGYKLKP